MVRPIPDWANLPITPDDYYRDPLAAVRGCYSAYLNRKYAHTPAIAS
jgi:hypothetical protein